MVPPLQRALTSVALPCHLKNEGILTPSFSPSSSALSVAVPWVPLPKQ